MQRAAEKCKLLQRSGARIAGGVASGPGHTKSYRKGIVAIKRGRLVIEGQTAGSSELKMFARAAVYTNGKNLFGDHRALPA